MEVAILIFDRLTALDVIGPYEVLGVQTSVFLHRETSKAP